MEKDYLEKIKEFYGTHAKDVMRTDFPFVGSDEPMRKVIKEMSGRCLDHFWIVADGKVLGVITEKDLLRATKKPLFGEEIAWGALDAKSLIFRSTKTAKEMMTHRLFTCSPDTEIATIVKLMTDNRIRHLPVVDGGSIVGEVTVDCIVKLVDRMFGT
jgi:CBS domain-containing protein